MPLEDTRQLAEQVEKASERLDLWFDSNGWAGWDPFDIRENGVYRRCLSGKLGKAVKYVVTKAEPRAPIALRRLLGVRRRIYPKGMGLLAAAYAELYAATNNDEYLAKAIRCARWLEENRSRDYNGMSWGYPFDWYSRILIPKGTPSSVVTATVGDGFWQLYKVTKEARYLDVCQGIAEFFLKHLRMSYQDQNTLCFSYTPLDEFQVHNANLFVAEFLARVGNETDNGPLMATALKAGNFALQEQNKDGSLYYWGKAQQTKYSPGGEPWIDHYHSGFEIRSLYGLWKATGETSFRTAYQRYYDFYKTSLFQENGAPRYTPDSQYPVDIHSCAEAILCNATLLSDHPEAASILGKAFLWTTNSMEYRPGQYAYWLVANRNRTRRIQIPFTRWGQSWMLRALGRALLQLQGATSKTTAQKSA